MRKGLSAVYGFVVIYLLVMAGLSAISDVASSQVSLQQSVGRARQIDAQKSSESLSVVALNNSVLVTNQGSTGVTLAYLVDRQTGGFTTESLGGYLAAGSNLTIPTPPEAGQLGVVTSLGNLFWEDQNGGVDYCPGASTTLDVSVSPSGSGFATPAGFSLVCGTQSIEIDAKPALGYAFAHWTGSGEGSYSGPKNSTAITPSGRVTETADFVPGVSISLTPAGEGLSSGGPNRTLTVVASGAPQLVRFSVGALPAGVSVSFSPASVTDSFSGATVKMTLAFQSGQYATYAVAVTASGSDNQSATATLRLQTTPSDGVLLLSGYPINPDAVGDPSEHKTTYWRGTYFLTFDSSFVGRTGDYYVPIYYSGGWTAGFPVQMATDPFSGSDIDLFQSGNQILRTSTSFNGANLCYNIGAMGGDSIGWLSNGQPCGGLETPTTYSVGGYASSLIDKAGNWWSAVDTAEKNSDLHIEVLTASNGGWSDVYVSPSFGMTNIPVPQLLQLSDGAIVLFYAEYSLTSPCGIGDYFAYTADGGYTWSAPRGPYLVGGSPLCHDRSSATAIGDTIYAGGVDQSGNLDVWSYDFDNGSLASSTLLRGVDYAALGSTGGTLTLAYSVAGACGGAYSLHIMWSYDGGANWNDSGSLGCVRDGLLISSSLPTFQVMVVSDWLTLGGLDLECFLYTV